MRLNEIANPEDFVKLISDVEDLLRDPGQTRISHFRPTSIGVRLSDRTSRKWTPTVTVVWSPLGATLIVAFAIVHTWCRVRSRSPPNFLPTTSMTISVVLVHSEAGGSAAHNMPRNEPPDSGTVKPTEKSNPASRSSIPISDAITSSERRRTSRFASITSSRDNLTRPSS